MDSENQTNKEISLTESLSKIDILTAENTKLSSELDSANTKIQALETELSQTKNSLTQLESKHRDLDKEVSIKVAEIASQSGVEPIKADVGNDSDESIEDLAKRIDSAQGIEKAKLIESNYERIIKALRGVC